MQRIDDTSGGHNLSVFDVRIVGKIGGYPEGDGSQDGPAGSSEEGFLAGADSGVGVHQLIGVHEGVHGIGGGDSDSSCFQDREGDLFGDGGVGGQLDEDGTSVVFSDPLNYFLDNLGDV